jgi:hypothetical protein
MATAVTMTFLPKSLPSIQQIVLDKEAFTANVFTERSLRRATLEKSFVECKMPFIECLGQSTKGGLVVNMYCI